MATKHQITLRFRDEYAKASKKDKGVILDRMCETLGIGRNTTRRRLAAASREESAERRRAERPRRYSDRSRQLLREVWMLMDMPCGKYLKAMLPQWLPVLRACGEFDDYGGTCSTSSWRRARPRSTGTSDRCATRPGPRDWRPRGRRANCCATRSRSGRRPTSWTGSPATWRPTPSPSRRPGRSPLWRGPGRVDGVAATVARRAGRDGRGGVEGVGRGGDGRAQAAAGGECGAASGE